MCLPPLLTLPPLPQRTQCPWTRPKDHLRERGDPLCYVSAREWNNTESSSANNSQWRSFSTCCLTKGKIRTDDVLSPLSLSGSVLLHSTTLALGCAAFLARVRRVLTPLVALLTGQYEIRGLIPHSRWHWVSRFSWLREVRGTWSQIRWLCVSHQEQQEAFFETGHPSQEREAAPVERGGGRLCFRTFTFFTCKAGPSLADLRTHAKLYDEALCFANRESRRVGGTG